MSNYGAIENPSKSAAQDIGFTKGFIPDGDSWIMEWPLDDEQSMRKIARRVDKSNCLFKVQQ